MGQVSSDASNGSVASDRDACPLWTAKGTEQRIGERGDMGRVQAAISRGMGDVTRAEGVDTGRYVE